MTEPSALDLDAVAARLLARRDELRRLAESAEESRRPVELDQSRVGRLSRMDALQDQAMALETERRRQAELKLIEAALARIKDGDFGYCLSCGEAIAPRRLDLDPTAGLCIDCAETRDRR